VHSEIGYLSHGNVSENLPNTQAISLSERRIIMLYLNAYAVVPAYGGAEEGGWWYDSGIPIASIPIPTQREPGKTYYMQDGKPIIQGCQYCEGTGKVEGEPEEDDLIYDLNYTPLIPCSNCGEIPDNPETVQHQVEYLKLHLADEMERREELIIALENHFAEHFPKERPTYE